MDAGLARLSSALEFSEGRTHPVFMPSLTLVALVSAIFDSLSRHTTCSEPGGVTITSYVN